MSGQVFKFDPKEQLEAVAKRAFGGMIDVRPLLPKHEAQIGRMMAESVPKHMRPKEHASVPEKSEQNRKARIDKLNDVAIMVKIGLTAEQIAEIRGVTRKTAIQWMRQIKKPYIADGAAQ